MKDFNEFTKINEEHTDSVEVSSYLHKSLSCLFKSRSQTHYFHLQTESFAEHKALNDYYDAILLLADSLAEISQGEFGRITGKIEFTLEDYNRDTMIEHFNETINCIRECQNENENDAIENVYDEIEALIMKTQYLLTLK